MGIHQKKKITDKIFLIILAFLCLTVCINAGVDLEVLHKAKKDAQSLNNKKYQSRSRAQKVKQIIARIVKRLQTGGVPESEISRFKKFQNVAILEIDKDVKNKRTLKSGYCSKKLIEMLDELERKHTPPLTKPPVRMKETPTKHIPSVVTENRNNNNIGGNQSGTEDQEKPKATNNQNRNINTVNTTFPVDDFLEDPGEVEKRKPFVVLADELKDNMDIMRKKVAYLDGNLNSQKYVVAALIILVMILLGLITFLLIQLSKNNKKVSYIYDQVRRIRQNASNAPDVGSPYKNTTTKTKYIDKEWR